MMVVSHRLFRRERARKTEIPLPLRFGYKIKFHLFFDVFQECREPLILMKRKKKSYLRKIRNKTK